MKKSIFIIVMSVAGNMAFAQKDSTSFKGYLYNDEYNVYMNINLYDKNINVPNHELFGEMPGYLGKRMNDFFWLITSGKIKSPVKAELKMINDYGSEDQNATLTKVNDSTYILRQGNGSIIKVANKGKWQKLPKEMKFKKKRK